MPLSLLGDKTVRTVSAAQLVEELRSRPLVVLYASRFKDQYDARVAAALWERNPGIRLLQIDLEEVDSAMWSEWFRPAFEEHIERFARALGWSTPTHVPTGYYLFTDGQPCAYDPGTPDVSNASLVAGGVVGLIGALLKKPGALSAALDVAFANPARRIVDLFDQMIAPWRQQWGARIDETLRDAREERRQREQRAAYERRLQDAYRLFGIGPADPVGVARSKRREAVRACHPDRLPADLEERAHELMVNLNTAWELICLHKGWGKPD